MLNICHDAMTRVDSKKDRSKRDRDWLTDWMTDRTDRDFGHKDNDDRMDRSTGWLDRCAERICNAKSAAEILNERNKSPSFGSSFLFASTKMSPENCTLTKLKSHGKNANKKCRKWNAYRKMPKSSSSNNKKTDNIFCTGFCDDDDGQTVTGKRILGSLLGSVLRCFTWHI